MQTPCQLSFPPHDEQTFASSVCFDFPNGIRLLLLAQIRPQRALLALLWVFSCLSEEVFLLQVQAFLLLASVRPAPASVPVIVAPRLFDARLRGQEEGFGRLF